MLAFLLAAVVFTANQGGAMKMTFPNGETKLMEFEDVVTNAPVDSGVFALPK